MQNETHSNFLLLLGLRIVVFFRSQEQKRFITIFLRQFISDPFAIRSNFYLYWCSLGANSWWSSISCSAWWYHFKLDAVIVRWLHYIAVAMVLDDSIWWLNNDRLRILSLHYAHTLFPTIFHRFVRWIWFALKDCLRPL